ALSVRASSIRRWAWARAAARAVIGSPRTSVTPIQTKAITAARPISAASVRTNVVTSPLPLRREPPESAGGHDERERGDGDPHEIQPGERKRPGRGDAAARENPVAVHPYHLLSLPVRASQIAFACTPCRNTSKLISTTSVAASAICSGPRRRTVTTR